MPKNCPICHADCEYELEEVTRADGLTGLRHKSPKPVEEKPALKPAQAPSSKEDDDLGI